ncbi:radical SAM protein [Acidovorax facilis]|uniref:radical SAM protein n=1 Tax=Acidovorax facilis TaxID=12917 RepID=UPI003D65CE41
MLDAFLLYAPLKGIITLVSVSVAERLRKIFSSEIDREAIDRDQTLSFFDRQGLFRPSTPDRTIFDKASERWKPVHVTFSTTQKCTLRCTYCYAEGGRLDDIDIPRSIAKAAIDLVISNAERLGEDPSINFLGEGEATASWREFRWAIDYFRSECKVRGLSPYVELSTNGVFPASRVEYLSEVCTGITFSLDGLADVHDKYRVLPNGKGSFDKVLRTMKAFDHLGKEYHVRSTVSREALLSLSEFIEFIGRTTKCKNIQLEPIFDVTPVTSIATDIQHPDADDFIGAYRKAKQVAAMYGIEIYYSGADTTTKLAFCGTTSAKNFLVTARGIVTSCNEVLQPTDPRAELFQYGGWNEASQRFDVSSERIDKLGKLNPLEIEKCKGCVAKFNCAGDCYAKTAVANGDPWAPGYTYRCAITRQLLKDNLLLSLLAGEIGQIGTKQWLTC